MVILLFRVLFLASVHQTHTSSACLQQQQESENTRVGYTEILPKGLSKHQHNGAQHRDASKKPLPLHTKGT